uniref:CSON006153 protein n=1 Tax=Culicoides sonorensis TaxID=179676 RepID=A0A336LAL8_CULSO
METLSHQKQLKMEDNPFNIEIFSRINSDAECRFLMIPKPCSDQISQKTRSHIKICWSSSSTNDDQSSLYIR